MIAQIKFDERDFQEEIMCHIKEATFNYDTKKVVYRLPDGNCTSMTGAIIFGKKINPYVKAISVFAGEKLISQYIRQSGGDWKSIAFGG